MTRGQADPGPGLRRDVVAEFVSVELAGHRFELAVDQNATDGYASWVRSGAATEPPLAWAQRFVEPDWQVLDLGANLGTFSLAIAHECHRVVAVEAMPDNASLLMASVARAGLPVVPVHAAVWDRTGTVKMADQSAWARIDDEGTVTVPAATLQDIVTLYADGPFRLAKVDIEGGEAVVVPELLRLVEDQSDFVLIYEANQAVSSREMLGTHRAVQDAGFELWYADPRAGTTTPADLSVPQPSVNCDVLAVKGGSPHAPPLTPVSHAALVERLVWEMTEHPIMIHRSYAYTVIDRYPSTIRDDAAVRAARRRRPDHPGASRELERFADFLGCTPNVG